MKKFVLFLAVLGLVCVAALASEPIKSWLAYDVKMTKVTIVPEESSLSIEVDYYYTEEDGSYLSEVKAGRFKRDCVKIQSLPTDVRQAVITLNAYLKQAIMAEIGE